MIKLFAILWLVLGNFNLYALCINENGAVELIASLLEKYQEQAKDGLNQSENIVKYGKDTRNEVWEKYKEEQLQDPKRQEEFAKKEMTYNGRTMKYTYTIQGEQPAEGHSLYIALHGGGGTSTSTNDSQWQHMQVYYKDSVKEGIYVAPRGITNTWNLHFVDESYPLYDRLIENMILFAGVNPNKVYILGFSAGGDGVYQISTRMPDRFAAVNMSAGHPNHVPITNLYNLPILLQVGEWDGDYQRNRVTGEYALKLDELQRRYPGGYIHQANIHYQKPHNFSDNNPQGAAQRVLANIQGWLDHNDRTLVEKNTNAIMWLRDFMRNPHPDRVVWDLTTRAKYRGQQHYWLDIGDNTRESLGVDEIVVRLEKDTNSVVVDKSAPYLKILLSQNMLDLNNPLHLMMGEYVFLINVTPNIKTMEKTLRQRGDVSYMFDVALELSRNSQGWQLKQVE